jgi:hypothetical protein
MKLTKLVWHFSVFSMIFDEFCKIFVNIEKEKKDRKGKRFAWAWSSSQRSGPNYKDSARVEKEAHRRGPLTYDILHQESRSILKTIKALPHFLSPRHLYI